MDGVTGYLSIGEVARRTGLSVHTLRFYEQEEVLLHPVRRAAGGRRLYREEDVDWLNVCVVLRASGMPLPDLRRYTALARRGGGTEAERAALLREHQERLDGRMRELSRCRDLIRYKIGVYEDLLAGAAPQHVCDASAWRTREGSRSG